jgi:parvulin-like peptidyl-prolyl isomerase
VRKYSQDPGSRATGGRYTICKEQAAGCLKTRPAFEQRAFKLKSNAISKPFKTKDGWELVQPLGPVRKAQKAKAIPFAQVKEGIRQTLIGKKKQDAFADWLKDTTHDYCSDKIAYAPGYKPGADEDPCKQTTTTTSTG